MGRPSHVGPTSKTLISIAWTSMEELLRYISSFQTQTMLLKITCTGTEEDMEKES